MTFMCYVLEMSRAIGAKRKYTPEVLADAAKLVQSGTMSLNGAANTYGIPKSTLHDSIKVNLINI